MFVLFLIVRILEIFIFLLFKILSLLLNLEYDNDFLILFLL